MKTTYDKMTLGLLTVSMVTALFATDVARWCAAFVALLIILAEVLVIRDRME